MAFLVPLIGSILAGLIGGGMQAGQQSAAKKRELAYEEEQRKAQASADERRRGQLDSRRAEIEQIMGNIDRQLGLSADRVRRGAEYSGVENAASREFTRTMNAADAGAAMSGLAGSGLQQSAAQGVLGNVLAELAQFRMQDQNQREQLIGSMRSDAQGQQGQLVGLINQILNDPAYSGLTGDEATAGLQHLQPGRYDAFGGALAGGAGAALPVLDRWAGGGFGGQSTQKQPADLSWLQDLPAMPAPTYSAPAARTTPGVSYRSGLWD